MVLVRSKYQSYYLQSSIALMAAFAPGIVVKVGILYSKAARLE